MAKRFRQFLDFILFSNLFISFCAAAQVALTYQVINVKPNLRVILLVFLATLVMYNLSLLLSKPEKPASSPYRRTQWFFSRQRLMASVTLIAVFTVFMISLSLSLPAQLLLAFLAMSALAYNIPLFRVANQRIRLRHIPGIKLFLIALVWSLTVVLLPIIELNYQQSLLSNPKSVLLLVAHRFIFITALTIPFDIRDMYQDKIYALKTIPVMLGETKSFWICHLLFLVAIALTTLLFSNQNPGFWSLNSCCLLASWLVYKSQTKRNEYYYFLFLDGILVLPWILNLTWSLING